MNDYAVCMIIDIVENNKLDQFREIPLLYFEITKETKDDYALLDLVQEFVSKHNSAKELRNDVSLLSNLCCMYVDKEMYVKMYQMISKMVSDQLAKNPQ